MLKSREHLYQHGKCNQGGRGGSPISVEEFLKERGKFQEMSKRVRELELQVEELTTQNVVKKIQYTFPMCFGIEHYDTGLLSQMCDRTGWSLVKLSICSSNLGPSVKANW